MIFCFIKLRCLRLIDADGTRWRRMGRGTNETAESGLLVKPVISNQLNRIQLFFASFQRVLCFIFGRIAYIVYDPHFKRRLLDPRIKCWQKPTLIHSVFYIAVKLQRDKT